MTSHTVTVNVVNLVTSNTFLQYSDKQYSDNNAMINNIGISIYTYTLIQYTVASNTVSISNIVKWPEIKRPVQPYSDQDGWLYSRRQMSCGALLYFSCEATSDTVF